MFLHPPIQPSHAVNFHVGPEQTTQSYFVSPPSPIQVGGGGTISRLSFPLLKMLERPNVSRLSGHHFSWTVLCHGSDPPSMLRLHTQKALSSGRRCQKMRPAHNRAIRAAHCSRSHFEAALGLLSKDNESENKTCLIEPGRDKKGKVPPSGESVRGRQAGGGGLVSCWSGKVSTRSSKSTTHLKCIYLLLLHQRHLQEMDV